MNRKLLLFFILCIFIETSAQQKIYDFTSHTWGFRQFNGKLIFEASEADTGREIWESDGTTSGTKLIKDIYPGLESSVTGLETGTAINNIFYFIAKDESSSGEIWKTDGTEAGTVKVTNFIDGRTSSLTAVGNSIYFLIQEEYKLQVWKTDATTGVSVLIKDNMPIWNTPSFQGKCNNTFIFTFQPYGTNDSRVWRSNGTSEGTFPITGEIDGNGSYPSGTSGLTQYIEHNNKLYFVSRNYLHETDGTLENTKVIGDVWIAQQYLVHHSSVIEANNNLYFMFFSADLNKLSIWKFDSVNSNVAEIYSKTSNHYFSPSNFTKTDNSLLFSSANETGGASLVSLNLLDNTVKNFGEISNGIEKPFIFIDMIDASTLLKINDNEYYIASVVEDNFTKGFILNLSSNSLQQISALENVVRFVSFNDYLYYSKDKMFWKYANNLSVPVVENKLSLVFYPNPSRDFISIKAENDTQIEGLQIFDLNGRLVSTPSLDLNNKIDISKLNQGSYLLKAKVNGALISKKIIKN
ncbi:T9SS type A sorting domain-containing protein [Flavobacterium nitrogenifigens]|uniref:Por secretion system C-terminal sorting domain-containing protein n=1 Tax=Flavobacterium nitrogenifigens TaxID=1617283 RepID=A0A521AN91_9FLAO|nr:T9SS type A sorting domain-containing protein [Flavobacterium nitrogenifigens]KAF2339052.1 T9SS type A sorting domain-containing protein [Flavobacterium nitrogenifigens]SMO36277.1 Por secretion system C-terminal sorting domain-containing protein [Flavobacterium nitrogenifigens]